MKSKAEKRAKTQAAGEPAGGALGKVGQLLLGMVAGMAAAKQDLMEWVQEVGLAALQEVFEADATMIAGPKGRHLAERSHHRWGTTRTELPFGGRRIQVERPRVRSKSGQEVRLPIVSRFQAADPLPERVLNQILLGVSTRGYGASLETPPPGLVSRGTSKSAASRHLVERMGAKMRGYFSRRLDDVRLLVLMVDGIEVAKHTVVVALGISEEGSKEPLGLWQGSTENGAVCTSLLQDLIGRGLKLDGRVLCVIDGGKGIRKAIDDVLGDLAVVQRCQLHKRRNLKDHLPKSAHASVDRMLREAYGSTSAETARKRLRSLVSWLESNGHEDAAASLREGMEETLTVLKLELPPALRRSLATTNAIENTLGTVRRASRNVKRWKGGAMVRRWTAIGLVAAKKRFRRIKGHREMPALLAALRPKSAEQQDQGKVA
jgi:transposase-like protein